MNFTSIFNSAFSFHKKQAYFAYISFIIALIVLYVSSNSFVLAYFIPITVGIPLLMMILFLISWLRSIKKDGVNLNGIIIFVKFILLSIILGFLMYRFTFLNFFFSTRLALIIGIILLSFHIALYHSLRNEVKNSLGAIFYCIISTIILGLVFFSGYSSYKEHYKYLYNANISYIRVLGTDDFALYTNTLSVFPELRNNKEVVIHVLGSRQSIDSNIDLVPDDLRHDPDVILTTLGTICLSCQEYDMEAKILKYIPIGSKIFTTSKIIDHIRTTGTITDIHETGRISDGIKILIKRQGLLDDEDFWKKCKEAIDERTCYDYRNSVTQIQFRY